MIEDGAICLDDSNVCAKNAQCEIGGFNAGQIEWKCSCQDGFEGDGYTCTGDYQIKIAWHSLITDSNITICQAF